MANNGTVSGTGSFKTETGLNLGVNTSKSSDGTLKGGFNVSASSGNTTAKAGVTIGSDGKKSSAETNASVEFKNNNTTVKQTLFFKIFW
ncbi:hypothetical protein [Arachidicoccus sp.]|uniref:hypothetical protein n=1 Tax=Arachidicoccus sp. TaxID=1872624 RepID=UPI003D1E64C2